MPDKANQVPWLKYLAGGLLLLILAAVLFYQPIIFGITQLVAQEVARSQALTLKFKLRGSIFTSLYIEDLHLQPFPGNTKLPVERIDAERVALKYSLLNLLKKDYRNIVNLIELKDVDVVVRPAQVAAPPAQAKPSGLRFPAVIPKKIDVQDVNLLVRGGTGNLEVKNFALQFRQGGEGFLDCSKLSIPGAGTWNRLHASISETQNILTLSNLLIPPMLELHRMQIDLSGSEQGKFGLNLDAGALGSSIAATLDYEQPESEQSIDLTLKLLGLDLGQLKKLTPIPLSGSVPEIKVRLRGQLTRPSTLSGAFSADAKAVQYDKYLFDSARISLTLHNGTGSIDHLAIEAGQNKLRAAGNFTLPDQLSELATRTAANVGLAVSVPEPERFVPGLSATSVATGGIELANGRAQAAFTDFVAGIGMEQLLPGFGVSSVDSSLIAAAKLPLSSDLWSSICAEILSDCLEISYRDARIERVQLTGSMTDGKTAAVTANVQSGKSHAELAATVPLPLPDAPFDPKRLAATVRFNVASVSDFIRQNQVEGNLTADGDLQINNLQPTGTVNANGTQIKYQGITLQSAVLSATFKENRAHIEKFKLGIDPDNFLQLSGSAGLMDPFPFQFEGALNLKNLGVFDNLLKGINVKPGVGGEVDAAFSASGDVHEPRAHLQLSGSQLQYSGLIIESLDLRATAQNSVATIETGQIYLNQTNYISFTGEAGLKEPYSYKSNGSIEFNDLGVFNGILVQAGQPPKASGNIHANWSFSGAASTPIPDAKLSVAGDRISYRGLSIQGIRIEGNLQDRKLNLPAFNITFNKENSIAATGNALLQEPYAYESNARVQFQDLGFLNELAQSFGQDLGLAGKLAMSWQGRGPLKEETGSFEIHGDQLRTKTLQSTKLDLAGNYNGFNVNISQLQVFSPYADVDATAQFSPELLQIPKLVVRRSGNTVNGTVKIPLDLRPGKKVPLNLDQPFEINIAGDKIVLASFQTGKPQLTGTVGFRLQASQTLRDPLVQLTATARDIKTASISRLSAANGDLNLQIRNKVLTVDGKVEQPEIHPLRITGKMPLDLADIIQTGRVNPNTPLQFTISSPDNNLAFARKIVPGIKVLEGSAGVNVAVNGTIAKPDLSGGLRANIARFQARTDVVPPISGFAANISFRHDRIQIEQLKGLAGGGSFGAGGAIDLRDGSNPRFGLTLTGRQVLLTRSDGIIVRCNLNLAVNGPLSGGEVSGTVGITSSRFFKDIDILPLNLPGRPAPQPPPQAMPKIAIETPPFNNWRFNVAIRSDDPFLIQSNLARGRVSINLQAGGTGATPSLTGTVRVDRLVANLPFSRMTIEGGRIDFGQGGNILDPSLSIVGRSTVSDYDVRLRIFGHASNPTVLLDSSPPLSQGDILVLLATGSPTSTYAQNPSLLAGRATFLVLQQLWKKFFPSTNRAESEKEPFIDRFSVNVTPGNRAGEQDIVSTFRLTPNWQIIGDFGTSSYQGRLKYLIRFR
ncbi:MAG: translocation/assembly module TamB domain-containing protein [Verrucomicrobia bacterium]|nr:translocation/assembly module TamB domain-containing protein [Verrucomicrobiota bacterium]